ncbi:hypothetical protein BRCON_2645 [Candidatus Sumerlaea chitinivorans]|uniref:Uncharacterized protein n=1 Tax=Sumerlaea chitinivorans TaxID=2250252 RepID=A0A2Z4Y808_SUMC1|nr:hypothetical protein BRCON_2645 [Candidatus Sumerlaea chitinivorans]
MRLGRTVDEGTVGFSGTSGPNWITRCPRFGALRRPLGQSFGQNSEFQESQTDLPIFQRVRLTTSLPKNRET